MTSNLALLLLSSMSNLVLSNTLQLLCYQKSSHFCDIKNFISNQYQNQIDEIIFPQAEPSDTFRIEKITSVRLDCSYQTGNNLKFIPVDLFSRFVENDVNLKEFEILWCLEFEKLNGNEFDDAGTLETLKISKTKLNYIGESSFKKLTEVFNLDLSSNEIEHFEETVFINMQRMSALNLSNNKLRCLPGQLLKHNTNLRHLRLESNELEFIDIPLQVFKSLRYANFENNRCMSKTYHWSSGYEDFVKKECLKMPSSCMNMLEVIPLMEDKYVL
jgi:hypothetical protein